MTVFVDLKNEYTDEIIDTVEFEDDIWALIELAAQAADQTPEVWLKETLSKELQQLIDNVPVIIEEE